MSTKPGQLQSIAGAEESRVTDLGETLGQDVSEEATYELLGREGRGLEIAGLVVAVVEAHGAVVGELIEAAVGDGDTEEIAAEVVEDLFAAASGFAVDDPGFFPGGFGDERVEAGFLQAVAKLAAEDCGQRTLGE